MLKQVLVAATLFAIAPAYATDKASDAKHPCRAERQEFCKGLGWKKGLKECLKQNYDKLGELCKAKVDRKGKMAKNSAPQSASTSAPAPTGSSKN